MKLCGIDTYLQFCAERQSPRPLDEKTLVQYRSQLRSLERFLGDRELTQAELNSFRQWLQHEAPNNRGGRGQAPRTIKGIFVAVRAYLKWLKQQHPDLPVPTEKVWTPSVGRKKLPAPTDAQVAKLFEAAESLPSYSLADRIERQRSLLVMSLAADCALRRCEILGLDTDHIYERQTTAAENSVMPRAGDERRKLVVRVVAGKNDNTREVPLNTRCRRLYGDYLKIRAEWEAVSPARKGNRALFPVDSRRRIDDDTVHAIRHRLLQMAGLPPSLRLHGLRHYRITRWLGVPGVNPATVAYLAGHEDIATTLHYAHCVDSEIDRAIEQSAGGAGSRLGRSIHNRRERPQVPMRRRVACR